ncbi:MAG TPA: beta-N-acetylhexosaminidase [Polyangiaceae bacterium]|nr:beta-N-acetylhexosaminidase [Polyangiaceae bacterium]
MSLESICGQLILGGFSGATLPGSYARALRAARRCGAILFARNLGPDPEQVSALCRQMRAATAAPLLAIDQEGGRVARLRAPFLELPSMRAVATLEDEPFAERIASAVGAELAAVGVNINFAPVVDVDTCPDNPIIADRAFGADPKTCERFGAAWIRGLQSTGILATAKHFPGHGDTSKDSHVDLPLVAQPRDRLDRVELPPFRAAAASGVAAMMTAHVVYPALDPRNPATLSHAICTVLREHIRFNGMLFSDDLEMRAIADHWPIADAAVQAIAAGCDALLVCHSFEEQEAAVDALVQEAERSEAFRERCRQAFARVAHARGRIAARPLDGDDLRRAVGGAQSRTVAEELSRRLSSGGPSR